MELLRENHQRSLLDQPESGMGFQVVRVQRKDGSLQEGTVFNAEYFLTKGESTHLLREIEQASRRIMLLERGEVRLGEEIESIRVVSLRPESPRVAESAETDKAQGRPADEAKEEELQKEETFK